MQLHIERSNIFELISKDYKRLVFCIYSNWRFQFLFHIIRIYRCVSSCRFPLGGLPDRGSSQRETQPLALLPPPVAAEAVQAHQEVLILRLRRPRPSHVCQHRGPAWRAPGVLQGPHGAGERHQGPCKGSAAVTLPSSFCSFTKEIISNNLSVCVMAHLAYIIRRCTWNIDRSIT